MHFHDLQLATELPSRTSPNLQPEPIAMPAATLPAAGQGNLPAMYLDTLKGHFNIATLMDKISNPVLEPHRQAKAILAKTGLQRPKESLQGSLQVTDQLVEQFEKYAPKAITEVLLTKVTISRSMLSHDAA